jgi:hypothetical protein
MSYDKKTTPPADERTKKYVGPAYTKALEYKNMKLDPKNFTSTEIKNFCDKYPERASWFK